MAGQEYRTPFSRFVVRCLPSFAASDGDSENEALVKSHKDSKAEECVVWLKVQEHSSILRSTQYHSQSHLLRGDREEALLLGGQRAAARVGRPCSAKSFNQDVRRHLSAICVREQAVHSSRT